MPMSSIKFHGAKIISMRCSGAHVACGEEGSGNVAIYRRKDLTRKIYHKLGSNHDFVVWMGLMSNDLGAHLLVQLCTLFGVISHMNLEYLEALQYVREKFVK